MPTLILFFDGLAAEKLIGFEGLSDDMPEGKEDEWPTIKLARILATKGAINSSAIVDDDGIEAAHKARLEEMRKNIYSNTSMLDFEDDDFSDND
jgi:hypothetical protein